MRPQSLAILSFFGLLSTFNSAAGAAAPGLELVIATDKPQVELGEPVYLSATLQNVSTIPVDVKRVLDPQTGVIDINIVGPDGSAVTFLPLFYSDSTIPDVRLEPGNTVGNKPGATDHVASVFPIFFGSPSWSFPDPGTYRISAVYLPDSKGNNGIASNVLSVTVTPSEVGSELISEAVPALEAGKFLLWQHGDHLEKGQAHLQKLLDAHPDSLIANYIRLARGRNLGRSFRDYTRDRIRPPQCEAARSYLEAVNVDLLPTYLKIVHALSLSDCASLQGDYEAATEHRLRAETLGANRAEFRRLLEAH